MGRIVPEIGDSKIRELFVYLYRLIYEISKEGAEILAIIHGRQNLKDNFNEMRK
jgi:plasmid stabilization system protein ParE